jgi:hypothetical protein
LIRGPPLWSSGQSSWLQIHRSGFYSQRYQIFWQVLGLERGPFSLVSTIEELLERESSGSGLENREYGCRVLSRWPRGTLYLQTLTLTTPTSGDRSVGLVCSQTQATEVFFFRLCRISYKQSLSDALGDAAHLREERGHLCCTWACHASLGDGLALVAVSAVTSL